MSLLRDDDDFSIDRFQLELEAERNASLMRKYGKLLAFAAAKVKDEKRKLTFKEAECAEIIRSNKAAYGIDKATDKIVFALAQNEPEYVKQFNKWLFATKKEEDYKSAVDTCRQRGMMIRVLTEQWLNNYYSQPVVYESSIKRKSLKRIKTDEDDQNLNNY